MKAFTNRLGFGLGSTLVLALLLAGAGASPAAGAELLPHELDPVLSLTGDCSTAEVDPVPDPGCPGGEHPPSGRFSKPVAVAIDPYGNEYVVSATEGETGRVDVFDAKGNFITELAGVPFPKNIAVDSKANLYVFSSDGAALRYPPTGGSQPELGIVKYEAPPVTIGTGNFHGAPAVDAENDQLLIVRGGVVTRYKSAAEGNGAIATSGFNGSWSEAMAIDAQRRRLYVTYCPNGNEDCAVKVLDADSFAEVHVPIDGSDTPAGEFTSLSGKLGLAVDEESGDFFIGDIINAKTVYRYSASYEYLAQIANSKFEANGSLQIAISNGEPSPGTDAFNRHHLFVPAFPAGNRVFAYRPPDQHPPQVKGVSSAGIGETEAELRASIDPEGLDTDYVFEYTTEQKFEAEGFTGATIVGEGSIPGPAFETEVSAQIGGLSPGTAYRFRVLAENELGKADEKDNQGSFTTYADAVASPDCPNHALRTGPSAALPDCRAWELVTPPETNGRIPKGLASQGDTFTTVQAAPSGEAVTFRIEGGSLPGTTGTGGFNGDPYAATRGPSGWTTALAGPSGGEATVTIPGAVSPDQGYSFWVGREEGSAVIDEGETRYVRYPDGHSELIGRGSLGTDPTAKGMRITEGGTHIVFATRNFSAVAQQLEPNAPPTGTQAVYDRTPDEVTHVVSLLPGDVTPAAGENAEYLGASADGEGIAFEIGGTLYLRKGNATTYEVGTGVELAGVSEGGERVFYLQGGDLLAYDTSAEEVVEFSDTGDVTPVNVATEGTRAAFLSPSELGGANPEGEVAQVGEQNLYLSEEGAIEFVATVTDRDVEGESTGASGSQVDGLGLWTDVAEGQAASDPSRLNPSGSVLLFQSRAELTGYDPGGFPQVYRYAAGRLDCISCIPTGAPATGGGALQSYSYSSSALTPFSPVVRVPNLTPDGDRVFFESTEALVSTDTDGVRDVYEWEEEGTGSCEEPGGCVYLISSGQSGTDNYLYGHSRSGNDVFIRTGDVLSGEDAGGTPSIYDARANGGFAATQRPGECLGEACQPSVSAPDSLSPASAGFRGPGNARPAVKGRRCPKGKRRVRRQGKARCVQRQHRRRSHEGAAPKGRAR